MKKIILSAAIAAICAAPAVAMADTQLYGQMRYSINSVDDENIGKDGISGDDNVSLFGLKGSAGDDKLKAFFHLQTGAPTDNNDGQAFNQRFYFAGLEGGFGKVAYGRMTNAYKFAGFEMDPFYNMSHINVNGKFATGGGTYGLSPATNGFTDNAVQYTSPSFSGVKVNAGIYIDDSNDDNHGTNFGISWSGNGLNVGVQVASNDDTATIPGLAADGDAVRVYGGYKGDGFKVAVSYEELDNNTADDPTYLYVTGTFNVSEKTRLVGSVGVVGEGAAGVAGASGDPADALIADAEGTGYTLAAFHTIVPKTDIYVSYTGASLDGTNGAGADLEDPSAFTIGAIHKFGFGG